MPNHLRLRFFIKRPRSPISQVSLRTQGFVHSGRFGQVVFFALLGEEVPRNVDRVPSQLADRRATHYESRLLSTRCLLSPLSPHHRVTSCYLSNRLRRSGVVFFISFWASACDSKSASGLLGVLFLETACLSRWFVLLTEFGWEVLPPVSWSGYSSCLERKQIRELEMEVVTWRIGSILTCIPDDGCRNREMPFNWHFFLSFCVLAQDTFALSAYHNPQAIKICCNCCCWEVHFVHPT